MVRQSSSLRFIFSPCVPCIITCIMCYVTVSIIFIHLSSKLSSLFNFVSLLLNVLLRGVFRDAKAYYAQLTRVVL